MVIILDNLIPIDVKKKLRLLTDPHRKFVPQRATFLSKNK